MTTRSIAFYMHDLSGGGVERMRLALIAELRNRGLDVRLVVACLQGPLVCLLPSDLAVEDLGAARMLAAVIPLARYLRRTRPDVLIASLDHNNVTALLARVAAFVSTSIVICQHNSLSAERVSGWRYRAIPWLYWALQSCARGIVAVSHGVADDLAETARIPRTHITTIYNPVIDADFAARTSGSPPHAWLADRVCPVFVFAGRLTHQKDPATLLNAMALLVRPARLIMLGEGPLLAELDAQAASLGIADRVAFAGFQGNPLPWILHADALVSSSRYEGLGNAIIEALACGTPVIATDCPYGPSEILLDGQVGRLVPIGDAAALSRAMQCQINEPCNPEILTARAAMFTAASCADAHLALFDSWPKTSPVQALGMRFTPLRVDQILDRIINDGVTDGVRLVVTPNLDHVRLLRNKAFAAAYSAAHFVCPDGFPVLLYARLRGLRLSARVTGCELFHRLANHSSLARQRLCVVVESGTTRTAVNEWAAKTGLTPTLTVLVAPAGLADAPVMQQGLAIEIQRAAPTILVMTLGAPISEIFVDRHRRIVGNCWALCVGQAVRIELGLIQRAPGIWRAFGLEWLWRIRQEPRRLAGRYVKALAWFPAAVLQDIWPSRIRFRQMSQRRRHAGLD